VKGAQCPAEFFPDQACRIDLDGLKPSRFRKPRAVDKPLLKARRTNNRDPPGEGRTVCPAEFFPDQACRIDLDGLKPSRFRKPRAVDKPLLKAGERTIEILRVKGVQFARPSFFPIRPAD
jgi:hypothetical protein